MFAITGITGKVGGELARALLAAGRPVRAVLRDGAKAAAWVARGCDIALADMGSSQQLAAAFAGAEAVFILPPPTFDPESGYPEARAVAHAISAALIAARPKRVLSLSTIGADAPQDNLLTQQTIMEQAIGETGLPVTYLRPAWFMENALWDVAAVRDVGVLHSFLQPVDKPFPMVATKDIGRLAANLIQQDWSGIQVVESEGPVRVSPDDLAKAFASVLGRAVRVEVVPRDSWDGLFRAQGMKNPLPRIRMLDGFNEGWIEFRDGGKQAIKGSTPLMEVIASLVAENDVNGAA